MLGKLVSVAVVGPSTLELGWDDGHQARVDIASVLDAFVALAALRDPATFASVVLSADGWSLEWPGGIDFGAQQLRRWADEQAGESMRASAFRAWMQAYCLTQDQAG